MCPIGVSARSLHHFDLLLPYSYRMHVLVEKEVFCVRTAFIIGNIASGKSFACRHLASRGAWHIDLDQMAKDLYVPGSSVVMEIADAFGFDVLDPEGGIDRKVLAARAFATPEDTALLDAIVHPVLKEQVAKIIVPPACCCAVTPDYQAIVIEVSAPRDFTDMFPLADDVIAITAPYEVRRERAFARGMTYEDFDARAACQPSEAELCSWASLVIDNSAADDTLAQQLDAWLAGGVSPVREPIDDMTGPHRG